MINSMLDLAGKNAARRNLSVEKLRQMALDSKEMQAVADGSSSVVATAPVWPRHPW